MTEELEVVPDAARTIEGLRDTGYDFLTAVADVVDNSVAAGSERIVIHAAVDFDGEIEVSIADNGTGMTRDEMINAMKYGSGKRVNEASLGKFGLGLKTASTAMCRRLTVASTGLDASTNAACWDLDYVAQQHKWLLTFPSVTPHFRDLLNEAADGRAGTVVLWEKVDRLLSKSTAGNKRLQPRIKALERQVVRLREHLGTTYFRFLKGLVGAPIRIIVNDKDVVPWDPFSQQLSEKALDESIGVQGERDGRDIESAFTLRGWLLPPAAGLTEDEEGELRLSPDRQGFYIYRENRLISAGDWLGMYSREMHMNLLRFDMSFDHTLDAALQIDLKKSRVRMPPELESQVKSLIAPLRKEANDRYRTNQKSQIRKMAPRMHETANLILERHQGVTDAHLEETGPGPTQPEIREVRLTNEQGSFSVTATVMSRMDGGPHVLVVPTLEEGLLWKPGVIGGKKAVLLNAQHPFYSRVYASVQWNPVAIQAIDFILWSLAEAEWASVARDHDEEVVKIRERASSVLRRLADDLPPIDDLVAGE